MQDVFGEVQIVPCKCPTDIIPFLIPAVRKLLKLRHDQIIASLSIAEGAHLIVNLPPAVQ